MRRAFSLVELSIVLVIIGLLVGGVLSGRALIRANELRAVPVEYGKFFVASQAFRDRFSYIAGDIPTATNYWGAMAACPGDYTTPSTDTATCNGDGNGAIASRERYRFWHHLANAGMIEGRYTGVPVAVTVALLTAGIDTPLSKIGGVQVLKLSDNGAGVMLATDPRHAIIFFGAASTSASAAVPILSPEEAWSIDTKMDDGLPGKGTMMNYNNTHTTVGSCVTSATADTATYALTLSDKACAPFFALNF
ncbi:MAG: prepilin-type N-terminal cleavage/methylation domain-containing protein [Pseudomonadota bacterium]